MSTRLFDKGRAGLAGSSNWTSDTIKAMMVSLTTTDVAIKAITGVTNASPMVVTSNSHGFSNGDIVVQRYVGGNTAANGTFQVGGVTTNTYQLLTVKDAQNTTGNAAYTSGGAVINLTLAAATTDVDGGRIATDQTLGSTTDTNGVLNAANPTFTSVTGTVDAMILYDNTTNVPIVYIDGTQLIVAAAAASSSATSLAVEPLAGAMANGTSFVMSNGVTVTLTASANAGDRTLTVSALSGSVAAGTTADAPTTGAGVPFTGSGGSYTWQFDSGANKIIKI
jgi:hypothetical protein